MDDLFEKTARLYQTKIGKPNVTAKLLQKPPFRFLHDVVMGLMQATGYPQGIFTVNECKSAYVVESLENKILFLSKIIQKVSDTLGVPVDLKPSKVVAGLEPEKTCLFLGALYKAATGESLKEGVSGVEKITEILVCEKKKDVRDLEIDKIQNSVEVGDIQDRFIQKPEKIDVKVETEIKDKKIKLLQEEIEKDSEISDFSGIESDLNRDCKITKSAISNSVIPIKTKKNVRVFKPKPIKQETLSEKSKQITISRKKKHSHKGSSLNLEELDSLLYLIQSLCSSTSSLSNLFQTTPSMIHLMEKESNTYNSQKANLATLKPLSSNQILAEIECTIAETQQKIREVTGRILKNSFIIKQLSQVDYFSLFLIWKSQESKTLRWQSESVP